MANINRERRELFTLIDNFYRHTAGNVNIHDRDVVAEYMRMINFMYGHLNILLGVDRISLIATQDDLTFDLENTDRRIHRIMGAAQLRPILQPLIDFLGRLINGENPFLDQ